MFCLLHFLYTYIDMSCISSIQELTRRSHIVTADVGVGEENQAREIVDVRQQVGDCPLHPRRITDIDDMTTIVIMNQKQIQGRDDTKHPQKNQRCCKYKETIVETNAYDGCSSIPHQATNTSTERHIYKVLNKNLQLLKDDDEEEGERTVKLSSCGLGLVY